MGHLGNVAKYGKKAISTFLVANTIYFGSLIGSGIVANVVSPKITSQTQLEQLVERERKKIDPKNNYNISANLLSEDRATSRKLDNGDYQIEIGGFFANETTLRHELYHILDNHFQDAEELKSSFRVGLKYLFCYEPQARIYQVTGLKP